MTLFYLVRHGVNDSFGQGLAGRTEGIHLNEQGRAQATALGERLAASGIDRVFASPMQRTRETAAPIAARLGLNVEVLDGINEVDFGQWTGRSFPELEPDPRWQRFNRVRSVTRIPGGELMVEVQLRMVRVLEGLRHAYPDGRIALVSHGDPIRVTLAYYAGIPLDLMQNIQIDPASVSTMIVDDYGARVRCLNHTGEAPTA